MAAPAVAQQPAADLPVCSRDVTDRCVQGPAAQRMQREEFDERSLGNDRSAKLSPKQAAAGMRRPQ